jgi:hypothetical protein
MASATLIRPRPGRIQRARLGAVPASTWAKAAFAAMCALALVGYFAFPTYPTYDSFYALLWGRDLLHLHVPDFHVYRGPTEHPLAIAFGALCSLFGQGGARLAVLGSIGSFVTLVAGLYRLGRLCFGPLVGVVAGLLVLSRFFIENLAAQGYLDVTYVALVVWAAALEVERPRRGRPVFLLLAAAGLLRPDAWLLLGVYWLWCSWPAIGGTRTAVAPTGARPPTGTGGSPANRTVLEHLVLAAIAPAVWVCLDAVVTGNPLYSLHSTSGLAQELGRTEGFSEVLHSAWAYAVRIDKLPVVLGGIAGLALTVWLTPRRMLVPLVLLVSLVLVFVVEGAAGASVVDRYMIGAAVVLLVFCAVALGGWSMLEPGSWLRRVWIAGALVLVAIGVRQVGSTLSFTSLRNTLAYHEDFHQGLAAALHDRAVKRSLRRCPLLSLPNNKLIPDARWILGTTGQREIVARTQARADAQKGAIALERRIKAGSVAIYPLGAAVFFEAIVDVGDDPREQVPMAGFKRIYTSRYYAVYANC